MNILALRDVTKKFGDLVAVDNLTIDIEQGELFGLIGPDGAGKTTTMRLMLGIMKPDSGEGRVGNFDLRREAESISVLTGYVSQRFSLYGELSVRENLQLFADLYGVPQAERGPRLTRLMQFSRLDPFQDRLAQNLSGGMRQKLALSCALIHTPALLLLDEPTTGVDPLSRRELWKLLFELWQDGVTIVVSTPYMDEAERCSRIGFLDHGKLIASGRPDDLRAQFRGSILDVGAEPRFKAKDVLAQAPYIGGVNLFGEGLHVTVQDKSTAIQQKVRADLEAAGVAVHAVQPVEPSIEDVFFQLTEPSRGELVG